MTVSSHVSVVSSVVGSPHGISMMSVVGTMVSVVGTMVSMVSIMAVVITVTVRVTVRVMNVSRTTDRRDRGNIFTRVEAITRVLRVVLNGDDWVGYSNLFGGWDLNINVVGLVHGLVGGVWHKFGDMPSVSMEAVIVVTMVAIVAIVAIVAMVSRVSEISSAVADSSSWGFPGLGSSKEKGSSEEFHSVFMFSSVFMFTSSQLALLINPLRAYPNGFFSKCGLELTAINGVKIIS